MAAIPPWPLHRELVTKRGWLGVHQFGLAYGLARATPGTNLLAFCAGVAWYIRGPLAAVLAVTAATAPAAAAILALTYAYEALQQNRLAAGVITATLAAAVGMMIAAAWQLVRPGLARRRAFRTAVLFGAACGLLVVRLLGPLQVIGLAAVAGLLWQERE